MLSLSMIVRDEAAQIEDCLRSVQDFVDEMVVVDTGSTDNTVTLAQAMGARVERIDWPGDFAPARNQALQWVSGDWVLVLDADERLRPEAVAPLRALMAQPVWDAPLLAELSQVMRDSSICGLGQAAPNAFDLVLRYFPEEVGAVASTSRA